MKVFTYYAPVPGFDPEGEMRLIFAWKRNWEAHGWEPVVLNEYLAAKHPLYPRYKDAIAALPSVGVPLEFSRACYLRWLAMAQQKKGGIMVDYGVFLQTDFSYQTSQITDKITPLGDPRVPCAMAGTPAAYLEVCETIMGYQPTLKIDGTGDDGGEMHVSDALILYRSDLKMGKKLAPMVADFGVPNWSQYTMVHFSPASMAKADLLPRWKHVEKQLNGLEV